MGMSSAPPRTYTVIALVEEHSRQFLVAGVIEGDHPCADSEYSSSSDSSRFFRFATAVQARDPDEAELLAQAAADVDADR